MNNFEEIDLFYTFNKAYIVDCCKLVNYCELKDDLIQEIKEDTIVNIEYEDIVKANMDLLEKVVKADLSGARFVEEELEKFGANILKVNDLVDDLTRLKIFFKGEDRQDIVMTINNLLKTMTDYYKGEK